jgi:uncharacterized protein (DUF433 family)
MSEPAFTGPFPGVTRDPGVCFGAFHIRGTGVGVSILANRHRAGDSVEALAEDYGVPQSWVRGALEWWEAALGLAVGVRRS